MKIAGWIQESIVDGPGLRFTLFVQGCPHACPGCHNPETHDRDGGREESAEIIAERLRSDPLLDGLTLSGGEPFCQAGECARLAELAHGMGLNVWTYTGYPFEKLWEMSAEDPDIRGLLDQTDVLVDGPFVQEKRSLSIPWRGSTNQRLLNCRKSVEAGKPCLSAENAKEFS